jgi:predicted nucleic acid-binding protein
VILLDTTVLVYGTGREHPLRDPSRELSARLEQTGVQAAGLPSSNTFKITARRVLRSGTIVLDVRVPGAGRIEVLGTHAEGPPGRARRRAP